MTDLFDVLTTPPPAVSRNAAATVLHEHYGLEGRLEALDSERDRNFLVTTADDHKYVLKFANSAEDAAVTDFQSAALLHVAQTAPELPVPRLVTTTSGRTAAYITAGDGRRHVGRLLTWLEGVPLKSVGGSAEHAATLGSCLARLGHALRDYEHAASRYALLWDLKRAQSLRQLLDHIVDEDLRTLCTDRLDVFDTNVLPKLDTLRWQVVHNDLNPSNVLVHPDEPTSLTGIIDFGDMVRTPLIADIAVASAYLLRDEPDPLPDVVDFVTAYDAEEPLRPEEIDVLFDLMLTRSTMTVVITHWRASIYPDNREYILRSESTARSMLERMSDLPSADATDRLRNACRA